jgi:hypothetical protein
LHDKDTILFVLKTTIKIIDDSQVLSQGFYKKLLSRIAPARDNVRIFQVR